MKKPLRLILLVLILVLSFGSTAFAYSTGQAAWISSVCRSSFSTTQRVSLPDNVPGKAYYWKRINVKAKMDFEPTKSNRYLKARPYSQGGTAMGDTTKIPYNTQKRIAVETGALTCRKVRLRIRNPYSGTNMESEGAFIGVYSYMDTTIT